MDAASLIILILGIIALGVLGYYFVICFQIRRPLSHSKHPHHSDMGPLLVYEEDYNGNHEEAERERVGRPVDAPDVSAPKPEDMDDMALSAAKNGGLETPLKSVTFQMTPECASKNPSNEGSVVLPIDEEPSHLDGSKSVLPEPHERPITLVVSERAKQSPQSNNDPHHSRVMPVIIASIPQKAMSVSYEEDGLLVQEPPQHDSRRVLERQKSAPESPIHYPPQMFIQGNPRQVQVLSPYYSIPHIIVDTDGPASHRQRTPCRPILKSPYSDPGTGKERVFVFGTKHSVDEISEQQPVKKVKMTSDKQDDVVPKEASKNSANEDDFSSNKEVGYDDSPPLGWVINLPRLDSKEEIKPPHLDLVYEQDVNVHEMQQLRNSNEKISSGEFNKDHSISVDPISAVDESLENKSVPPGCGDDSVKEKDTSTSSPVQVQVLFSNEAELLKESEGLEEGTEEHPEEEDSESSDPDITEYSFQRGSHTPDPAVASVLLNEVSCYPDKIGLTNYVSLSETSAGHPTKDRGHQIIGHPPTPTSDTTKSISPMSSNDNSLDEINAPSPSFSSNVLGTPPNTPPPSEEMTSPAGLIIQNPSAEELTETTPAFIEIETHRSRLSSSASASSSSSSLSSSTSTSNGSYKIDGVIDDKNNDNLDNNSSPKQRHFTNRSNPI